MWDLLSKFLGRWRKSGSSQNCETMVSTTKLPLATTPQDLLNELKNSNNKYVLCASALGMQCPIAIFDKLEELEAAAKKLSLNAILFPCYVFQTAEEFVAYVESINEKTIH